jgi:hypothetical protein
MTAEMLTPERMDQIVADVRRGTYAKVAASRAGICDATFRVWFARGKGLADARAEAALHDQPEPPPPEKYELFYLRVAEAQAEARTIAEQRVYETNPRYWLTHGPARLDWRKAQPDPTPPHASHATERFPEVDAAQAEALEQEYQEWLAQHRQPRPNSRTAWNNLQRALAAEAQLQALLSADPTHPDEPGGE